MQYTRASRRCIYKALCLALWDRRICYSFLASWLAVFFEAWDNWQYVHIPRIQVIFNCVLPAFASVFTNPNMDSWWNIFDIIPVRLPCQCFCCPYQLSAPWNRSIFSRPEDLRRNPVWWVLSRRYQEADQRSCQGRVSEEINITLAVSFGYWARYILRKSSSYIPTYW